MTDSGSISGVVTDQQDAAIAGARATATDASTGAAREIVTNGEGPYRIGS